jgi:TetR/AcrR family transcriptional repressor of nem operon
METNRRRILDEASRLFREHGFAPVTIVDVMKAAGQTHGGFYGHFASKDALIAAVVAHSHSGGIERSADLAAMVDLYLAPAHREAPGAGCPTAAFAGLMRQQAEAAKVAMAEGIEAQIRLLSEAMPPGDDALRRRAAIGHWSAMVGALVLSRAVGDTPLTDELLSETRAWLHASPEREA